MTADSKDHTCRHGHGRQRKKKPPRSVSVQLGPEYNIQFHSYIRRRIYFKLLSGSILHDIIRAIQRNCNII